MPFDWVRFLNSRNIPYVTSGPNVARGHVAIRCPFCGTDDPSEHMGIDIEGTKGWACWRNKGHRGKGAPRLISALIGCDYATAAGIAGVSATFLPDDFLATVKRQLIGAEPVRAAAPLDLPHHFRAFEGKPSSRPFVNYLRGRGFTDQEVDYLTEDFDVRYCSLGPYHGRVIFPVYFDRELVTWTGRSIHATAGLRYKTLGVDAEQTREEGFPAPAIGPINDYLLWYDDLLHTDADTIVLGEGPFDALKVRTLGADYGVTATCFFTSGPTARQIGLLHELLPRFKRRLLLLDRGAIALALRIQSELTGLDVELGELASELKDPGELRSLAQVKIRRLRTSQNLI